MSRRPPCGRWCPFVLTCRECDWQGGPEVEWTCQACGKQAPEGDVICGECAGQGSYNQSIPNRILVQSESAVTRAAPGSAGNAPEGLATGTSPSYGQGGKPDGYHE